MYVCICNAVKEKDFIGAARRCGGGGAEQVYASMGKVPQCGQCLDDAEDLLFEERQSRTRLPAANACHGLRGLAPA